MFLYHAGLIALAGGRAAEGRELLQRALALNPSFAFPQAEDARRRLSGGAAESASNPRNAAQ
jgi:hypothetical protein